MSATYLDYDPSCDPVERENERMAIADILDDYDELLDKCMNPQTPLNPQEEARLNDLHETLSILEADRWHGVHPSISRMVQEKSDAIFPMIQYEINYVAEYGDF